MKNKKYYETDKLKDIPKECEFKIKKVIDNLFEYTGVNKVIKRKPPVMIPFPEYGIGLIEYNDGREELVVYDEQGIMDGGICPNNTHCEGDCEGGQY